MKKGEFDIEPKDEGEAEELRRLNKIKQSGPSASAVLLNVIEKRSPGFKKRFREEQGIIDLTSVPRK